jgi:hypothetical protein
MVMGANSGSQASPEAPTGLRPPGFDPGRVGWLHLRPQFTYHAEASIVGTRKGIEALRDAVEAALSGGEGEATVCASGGEGYGLTVRCSRTIAGLGKPTYLDEEARHLAYMERDYLVRTSKFELKQQREALEALRWCRQNGNPHSAIAGEARSGESKGAGA